MATATSSSSSSTSSSDLTNTLLAACRADPAAEARLREWSHANFAEFAHALAVEIARASVPPQVRQMAALYLKNLLYAKSAQLVQEQHQRWMNVTAMQRHVVKQALLESMASVEPMAAHSAALAASEIAAVELPYNQWNEFVPTLMERVTKTTNTSNTSAATPPQVQLASLECLGYTAERIADLELVLPSDAMPTLSPSVVDKMLTTIVDGVQPSRSNELRLAAMAALKNSLVFVRKNMQIKSERDFIWNAICEATRCSNASVRQLAFACMDQIAEYYYDTLQDYMTVLFQLTTEAIRNNAEEESVKMAAIEFWSTVAYTEQGLLDEERELLEQGAALHHRQPCPKYTASAMETLVPLLLDTLTKQEEDGESDAWNLQAAGAVCLETISSTVEGMIVPCVMPFVEQNITNGEWRLRDASIVAFASILDGPATTSIGPFVVQAIPVLLQAFQDQHVMVRDSAVHCIAKICRLHIVAVPHDLLHTIIQALILKLQETTLVAAHACSAIFNIAQNFKHPSTGGGDNTIPETNLLSSLMLPLLQALLAATDREDSVESNLRVSAMSAAAELVNSAARDTQPIFRDFLPVIVQRMDAAMQLQVVSKDDAENKEILLGLLCALVTVLFQRLDKADILPHVDHCMNLLLQTLSLRLSAEEALLSVGAIAGTMEEDFSKYMSAFMPFLVQGLKSVQAQSLCTVSVGVIVDICTAVGAQIQPYCDEIMTALREALEDSSVTRDIKPIVISCFGDIAMAIGAAYEPYLQVSVMMLMQAAQQSAPADDDDLVAFINSLRLAILEAYSGIIMGLADGNALQLFIPNVTAILQFLQFLAMPESNRDEDVLQKAVALIGDIAQQMGNQVVVRQQMAQPFVSQLIQEAMSDPSSRDIAQWTQSIVHQVIQQTA